jgi:hypothetical protein
VAGTNGQDAQVFAPVTLAQTGVFTGSVVLHRFGNVVYAQGTIARATGFATTYTTCTATIPAGWRPIVTTEQPGAILFGTTVNYQFTATTAGLLQVRHSAANVAAMAVNFFWRIA